MAFLKPIAKADSMRRLLESALAIRFKNAISVGRPLRVDPRTEWVAISLVRLWDPRIAVAFKDR